MAKLKTKLKTKKPNMCYCTKFHGNFITPEGDLMCVKCKKYR